MKEREKRVAEFKKAEDLLAEEYQPKPMRPANEPARPVPPIRAIIAAAIDRIGTYADLDNKQQVVAMIDEVYYNEMMTAACSLTVSVTQAFHFFVVVLFVLPPTTMIDRKCASIVVSVYI